jgi:hypothetical protein
MKKIVSILVLLLFTGIVSLVKAQDVIYRTDGSEIRSTVTEVGMNEIKYKLFNDQSGRLYSLAKSDIARIVYSNGSVDSFSTSAAPAQTSVQTPAATQQTGGYGNQGTAPVTRYRPPQPDDYKKGYAGISVSAATLIEEYNDASSGYHFNVNAGYLFSKYVGINASFLLSSFDVEDMGSIGLRGGLVGPLFSFGKSARKIEFDIRPTVGIVSCKVDVGNKSVSTDKSVFAFGFGWSVRWNVSSLISLTGNMDFVSHGEFEEIPDADISSIGIIGVGVNFRF